MNCHCVHAPEEHTPNGCRILGCECPYDSEGYAPIAALLSDEVQELRRKVAGLERVAEAARKVRDTPDDDVAALVELDEALDALEERE